MPTIQDIHKSAELLTPSKKVVKPSSVTLKTSNNNHSGLVPYAGDSSESSDENENDRVETEPAIGSSISLPESARSNGDTDFKITKNANEGSDKIEIKRRLSKPFAKLSFSPNLTNGNRKISPVPVNSFKSRTANQSISEPKKVIATGSWTVTDTPPSPSAGSTCSSNSATSTSDWHVTTNVDSPVVETAVNSLAGDKAKENGIVPKIESGGSVSFSNTSIYSSPKLAPKNSALSNPQEFNHETSSCGNLSDSLYSISSPSKKSDFRKQQSQTEQTFPERRKKPRNPKYSFLKRTCNSDVSKVSPGSNESKHDEIGLGPLPKKAKHSEEYTESTSKNGLTLDTSAKNSIGFNSENSKQLEHSPKSKYSKDSPFKNGISVKGEKCDSSENESSKDKKKSREIENISGAGNSRTPSEYVWVEKTKDGIENNHRSLVEGMEFSVLS